MKAFKSQSKKDLEALFEKLELDLPEGKYTQKDLVFTLEDLDITPENIDSFNKKQEREAVDHTQYDSMTVVCMDRKNIEYRFKKFKFTQSNKYILMSKEDADELLRQSTGFHKASPQEVNAYFRKQ